MGRSRALQLAPFHILWVYGDVLGEALDAATWLETTRELRQLGWRVTLLAAGPEGPQTVRGVDIVCLSRLDVYFVRRLVFYTRVMAYIIRLRPVPDVVLFDPTSAMWLLALRLVYPILHGNRGPLLVMDARTLHMPPVTHQGWRGALQRIYKQLMTWAGNRWADGQTTITHRMADVLHVPPRRFWGAWPSGVNLEAFGSASVGREWPGEGMSIHLVYTGVLHYERNLRNLCLAVMRANTEGMPFVLTLIGDGAERAELQRLARGSSGCVRWLPPIPHDQVAAALTQAHIGVLPFPDEEKFRVSSPIKLFEYMAAGLPVLATRIACHTDVIGDGDWVFWAERSDVTGLLAALQLAWQGRAGLSRMGANAAAAASSWTWRASAAKLAAALEHGLERTV